MAFDPELISPQATEACRLRPLALEHLEQPREPWWARDRCDTVRR